ncbi:DUF6254 family protein [Cohnella hongkongensis]|uniref:DUF6254 family protein n=1 Tax=Cohnella hongkongensis TaxID=178337 RepID=A0ABV9F9L5_9BACL
MTTSKRRRESAWKSRKQNQHPHGKISSLHELADEPGEGRKPESPT